MKFLVIPENNSLSHIAKSLTVTELLTQKGHEVHLAIGKKHKNYVKKFNVNYHILSDIQEADSGGFPSFKWFSNVDTITDCIREEIALINQIQPDKVLGIFRFTLYASSQIVNVPYDSLICGCMIPDCKEVLGFNEHDPGIEQQQQFLNNFFRFAGLKASQALHKLGLEKIEDIRFALKGHQTLLWDFPEFMPIDCNSNTIHVGPITLHHWPYDRLEFDHLLNTKYPIAVVSFGTCVADRTVVLRIVRLLLELGYQVIVASGGQGEIANLNISDPRVTVLNFAPLNKIFPFASLLVTHGGQMTVFEALQNKIPVCVIPLQPEQAHNGVCLERIGCGRRMIPSTHFTGVLDDYIDAFHQVSDRDIMNRIEALTSDSQTKDNLAKIKTVIDRYRGAETITEFLEVS